MTCPVLAEQVDGQRRGISDWECALGKMMRNPVLETWSWQDAQVQVSRALLEIPAWSLEGPELEVVSS